MFASLAEGLDHPEGLAWGPEGRIYAGGEAGQIYAITLDGVTSEVAGTGGSLLGIALDGRGRIYACDAGRTEVLRVDPSSGSIETILASLPGSRLTLPNALAFAPDGVLYVTDSGSQGADDGQVLRVVLGGEAQLFSDEVRAYPNGCCVAPDGSALYVVESALPGISRIPIHRDGTAGRREVIDRTPVVPDGCALDVLGAVLVSCYRPDRIYRIQPGEPAQILADDPRGLTLNAPTNIAFVGDGLHQLAAANVGEDFISIAWVEVPGVPLAYPDVA